MHVCQPTYFLPLNCHHHWYHDNPAKEVVTKQKREEVQTERKCLI